MMQTLKHYFPLLLILLVAAALRLPMLTTLPPGLSFDEAGNGVAALDIAGGNLRLWWTIGGGKEPLMAYLTQPLLWLLGQTSLTLRLYSALMGIGTVAAVWFMAARLFPTNRKDRQALSFLPAFSALGLATAFWHVAYSRIAFRALAMPAVAALALGFLWWGLHRHKWRDFVWGGFFTGILFYTYLAGRLVPLAIVIFFGLEALLAWRQQQTPLLWRYRRQLVVFVLVAVVVAAPLLLYFAQNPSHFSARADTVSIFSPAVNGGDLAGMLWRTTATTIGTYLALSGDPNPLANIPGKPALDFMMAIFLLLGLVTVGQTLWQAVTRSQNAPSTPAASLFLLVYTPVMLLPAILAPEGAPHHLRLIGAAPGIYILTGLGMTTLLGWLARVLTRDPDAEYATALPRTGWAMLVGLLLLTGGQTAYAYFIDGYPQQTAHPMAFDLYAVNLAEEIAAEPDPTVSYVIPMDLRAADEARHYTLDYLYPGERPFHYLPVDEETAAATLTAAAQNAQKLAVVRWLADKHQEADSKGLVDFLLATGGAMKTGQAVADVYRIDHYTLPNRDTRFSFPPITTTIDRVLDGKLQIRRATVLPDLTADRRAAVAVTLAPIAPIDADYKASVRLIGPDGAVVAQTDRLLQHNWHQGTSLWPAEEVNEYYLLSVPANATPGTYTVKMVVYHPETLAPLVAAGDVEITLGEVAVRNRN